MKTLVEEIKEYRNVLTEDTGEFTPRSYQEERPGVQTHQTTLPDWTYKQAFELTSIGSSKEYPNTVRAKYTNVGGNKEDGTIEYIVTVYDRLMNEVEVIRMGGRHLPVYFDFDSPEKAQRYLNKFNIELRTGSGYIK